MGFEIVVRPVVLPNIRPGPARSLPPVDDPEQGFAEIRGNPSQVVELSYSYSMSATSSKSVETEREVDVMRVYQEEDDGTINRDNFVDIEVATRINRRGAAGKAAPEMSPAEKAQRERTERQVEEWNQYYRRLEERKNIERRERDQIRKNEDAESQWSVGSGIGA